MVSSVYTGKDLEREARSAVKGKGRYLGWVLHLKGERGECALEARYVGKDGVLGFVFVAI